jgi:hypothetical protein
VQPLKYEAVDVLGAHLLRVPNRSTELRSCGAFGLLYHWSNESPTAGDVANIRALPHWRPRLQLEPFPSMYVADTRNNTARELGFGLLIPKVFPRPNGGYPKAAQIVIHQARDELAQEP